MRLEKNHMKRKRIILAVGLWLAALGIGHGGQTFDIRDFGAVGDGKTMNTESIRKAVESCAAKGGGKVLIPSGTYLTGSVELKSNVTLVVGEGAVLRGSDSLDDYPFIPFQHNELGKTRSLLWAIGKSGIGIEGSGIIDLNDHPFMDWDSHPPDGLSTGHPLSEANKLETTARFLDRPTQPIFFHNCERLRINGVTIRNAPCWTITASLCRDIKIVGITIDNNLRTPNSDGLHFCGSRDIVVADSVFSAGDDCIAVTGITDWEAVSENIVISNCTMRSRSAAIRFGHKASKVRNVVVSNLTIHDSNRGIAIKAGDGGWVKNLLISNIVTHNRIIPGRWWGKGEPLVIATDGTGLISGVSISQVRAESENGIVIAGREGSIRDVDLRDWTLKTRLGVNRALFKQVFDVQPAEPIPAPDPAKHIPGIFVAGVDGLRVWNLRCSNESDAISVEPVIERSSGVRMSECEFSGKPYTK
jgi:polygalacturonase